MALANRDHELKACLNLAQQSTDYCIVLISGSSGIGKTFLLDHFESQCPSNALVIRLDLQSIIAPDYLFSQIIRELQVFSKSQHQDMCEFNRFEKAQELASPQVAISNNYISGSLDANIVMPTNSASPYILSRTLNFFFQDLCEYLEHVEKLLILAIDKFNDSQSDIVSWLDGGWLPEIKRSNNVRLILSGQKSLEENSQWERHCKRFHLDAIHDPQKWENFTKELGLEHSSAHVEGLVRIIKGSPQALGYHFHQDAERRMK
ncbi:MAG: ATP-binding protein [Alkalinema sp. RU_4_3]|nr:ATP-binding protein [Alkalinema sp. RU_4_3]